MSGSTHHLPVVSVVLPTYNRVQYIRSAVASILSQSFDDFELLVVDDSSTDDTWMVVQALMLQEPRIRLVRNMRTKGASGARNTALDHVRGKYIAFLDSDDIWLPSHLAKAVAALEQHPQAAMYFGNRIQFNIADSRDLSGAFPGESLLRRFTHTRVAEHLYLLETEFRQAFFTGNPIALPSVVLRTEAMGGERFDESMRVANDRDFWIRLCLRPGWQVLFTDHVIARIGRHETNLTNQSPEAQLGYLRAHLHIFNKLLEDGRLTGSESSWVRRQARWERSLIPYTLREAERFGEALKSQLALIFTDWPWRTVSGTAKILVAWIAAIMRQNKRITADPSRRTSASATLPETKEPAESR